MLSLQSLTLSLTAIIDHHDDRGLANDTANPRIIERSGSCSSLVTRYMMSQLPDSDNARRLPDNLDELEVDEIEDLVHGPLPKELVELLLRTSTSSLMTTLRHPPTHLCSVAIDSSGLGKEDSQPVDVESASQLYPRSSWKNRKMKKTMKLLDDDMKASRKALDDLDLRSLVTLSSIGSPTGIRLTTCSQAPA